MRKFLILLAIVAVCYGVVASYEQTVSADPAFVLNAGRDFLSCAFGAGPYSGEGPATLVVNDGGQTLFSCHGSINEEPPDKAVDYAGIGPLGGTCRIVITPSGHFAITCHQ